jgi:hypothetical protein
MRKSIGTLALLGAAAATGIVVLAGGTASAAPHASSLDVTVDYTQTTWNPANDTIGSGFVGTGTVTDQSGKQVGTAEDTCYEVSDTNSDPGVSCTEVLTMGPDELEVTAVGTIDPNRSDYPYSFPAIVTGGTGRYDGATGDGTFTATAPAVYELKANLK